MIHIYTVKWGEKYSSEHVNKIYKDCFENIYSEFKFYCLTENPEGLLKNVTVIPLPKDNYYEKWWNKLYLFDKNIVTQRGEKMFLDLDIEIQRELDSFINYNCDNRIFFIKTYWHDLEKMKKETEHVPTKYTDLNSSVLRWNDSIIDTEIMDNFWTMIKDYPSQIFFYFRGLDNLFYNRFPKECIDYFPPGWVYSYNYGYYYPVDVEKYKYRDTPYICLYDSMERPEDVKIEFSN